MHSYWYSPGAHAEKGADVKGPMLCSKGPTHKRPMLCSKGPMLCSKTFLFLLITDALQGQARGWH